MSILLDFYKKTESDPQAEENLQGLSNTFCRKRAEQPNRGGTRTVRIEIKSGLLTENEIPSGPMPKHHEHRMISSPDGGRLIAIKWSNGSQASTGVSIGFKTASSGVYQVEGIHPDLDAFWKDNHTVVIRTSKNYTVQLQHKQIQSFDDVLTIEYVE